MIAVKQVAFRPLTASVALTASGTGAATVPSKNTRLIRVLNPAASTGNAWFNCSETSGGTLVAAMKVPVSPGTAEYFHVRPTCTGYQVTTDAATTCYYCEGE